LTGNDRDDIINLVYTDKGDGFMKNIFAEFRGKTGRRSRPAVFPLIMTAVLSISFCSCDKKSAQEAEPEAEVKKETRKIIDYSDPFEAIENADHDCSGFVKSGTIEKSVIFNDRNVEITAESIDYRDDHAELSLTVKNSNSFTLALEKSVYVLNYVQNMDAGVFAVGPDSTETWIYNIDYFPMMRFGVEQLDTIQFGIKLYEYSGDRSDITDETTMVSLLDGRAECIPPLSSSDSLTDVMDVFETEVIRTSNFRSAADRIMDTLEESFSETEDTEDSYEWISEEYGDVYLPEDPLLASFDSGYIDTYFLQKTSDITATVINSGSDFQVASAAYGEIINEENPGNKWVQYAFYNGSDDIVNISTKNVQINGISVLSRSSSFSGINCFPGTENLIHDLMFPVFFNKPHWDIFGIDDIHTLSFDYEVKTMGKSEGTTYHADVYFEDSYDIPVDTSGETVYEKNNIVIKSKGIFENAAYCQGDYTAAFLAENNTSDDIYISLPLVYSFKDDVNFVKVNGETASAYSKVRDSSLKIPAGGYGEYLIDIDAVSLKERNINSSDDISEFAHTVEIRDSRERLLEQADIVSH